jgi:hypothetical protein
MEPQDVKASLNERVNFPPAKLNQIVLDATYFANFGVNGTLRQADQHVRSVAELHLRAALATRIANPFYNYLTPEKFSGSLRYQQFLTRGDLLKPYPQYVNLTQQNTPSQRNRYQALQLRAQRPFAKGFNLLVAYNYNRDRSETFFNSDAEYAGSFVWMPATRPRHRISTAAVAELPFGKGRPWLAGLHPVLEGVIGGWQLSSMISYQSGDLLTFGQMEVSNPAGSFVRDGSAGFHGRALLRTNAL